MESIFRPFFSKSIAKKYVDTFPANDNGKFYYNLYFTSISYIDLYFNSILDLIYILDFILFQI